uniref:Androgen-induced gene 1 protein-like n=1 Tax=Rhabditophanes sp. KR3021 TaxID=114890 RepID=A0AC35U8X5_9BILA
MIIQFIFHLALTLWYGYIVVYDYEMTKDFMPIKGNYLSKFVWLTHIDLFVQIMYHFFAILYVCSSNLKKNFKGTFDFLATAFVFPLAAAVVILFWSLYIADPDSLADPQAQKILSVAFFNHTIHTLPLIAMIVDFFLWKHTRAKKGSTLQILFTFAVLYLVGMYYVYGITGKFPYPILDTLEPVFRILFILVCLSVLFACFILGDIINVIAGGEKDTPTKFIRQGPSVYGTLENDPTPPRNYRVITP